MALLNFNPLYTLTLPILILFSLPVAIFACITTIIAFNSNQPCFLFPLLSFLYVGTPEERFILSALAL